ncbi:MAG: tetratricopeptide repeat protein [Gammaproteobacteria bacterium]
MNWCARLLLIGVTLVASGEGMAASPLPAPLEVVASGPRELLLGVRGAGVTLEHDGRGVVARFPGPLAADALAGLAARYPAWIFDLRYGFDSFYLEPASDVVVEIVDTPEGRALRLVPAPATATAPSAAAPGALTEASAADDDAGLRLDRLAAALRGRDGDHTGARSALRAMMEARPDDLQTAVELIEQQRALGRWRDALALYDRALAIDPDTAFLVSGKAALLAEYGSQLRASFDLFDVEDEDRQLIWVLENRVHVDTRTAAGLRLEYRDVDDPTVQHPRGAVTAFDGRRAFGTLWLEHAGPGPGDTLVELHGADAGPGVSLGYRLGWNPGETQFVLDLWRPYWDFVEGIVHGGYRHRAHLRHRLRTGERWFAELAAHASRYGLDGAPRIADAAGAQLTANWRLFGDDPRLALEYYFDTEYFGDVREARAADGTRFQPVAFTDREIHQLHLAWTEQLTDYVRLGARGGYTWDRLNGRGHNLGAELVYAPLPDLELGVRFAQSIIAARGGANRLTSVGGYLVLRL